MDGSATVCHSKTVTSKVTRVTILHEKLSAVFLLAYKERRMEDQSQIMAYKTCAPSCL